MAAILKAGIRGYYYLVYDLVDKRTDNLFLMYSVWQPLTIVACYLYFCLSLGPRLMKNRKPMKLEPIIKLYNLLQIFLCMYIIERCLTLGWGGRYKFVCEPVDYSETPHALEVVRGVWSFMMLKLYDLADTVFFVLRKKSGQVSFLHVYHHAGVFFGAWVCTKYIPGGHGTFIGLINSFVHIIMYLYYFMSMQWPEYKENMWWKKYITQMQMLQFFLLTMQSLPALFMKDCNYPKPMAGLMVFQYSLMFVLFLEFYIKAYHKKAAQRQHNCK